MYNAHDDRTKQIRDPLLCTMRIRIPMQIRRVYGPMVYGCMVYGYQCGYRYLCRYGWIRMYGIRIPMQIRDPLLCTYTDGYGYLCRYGWIRVLMQIRMDTDVRYTDTDAVYGYQCGCGCLCRYGWMGMYGIRIPMQIRDPLLCTMRMRMLTRYYVHADRDPLLMYNAHV